MGFDCANFDFTSPDSESVFQYCPSLPAAIIFTSIFGLSTLAHIFQAFYHHKWRPCWVVVMGSAWETVAFGLRAKATQDPTAEAYGIPSIILIFLAPLLVNAFAYMVLGRMVFYYLNEKKVCGIKAKKLTVVFVWLDIIAFIVQYAGAMMSSIRDDDDKATDAEKLEETNMQLTGIRVYMGGIGFQLLWILVFSAVAWRFRIKTVMEGVRGQGVVRDTNWKHLLIVLYFTLAMIVIRIVFRLVEFSAGIYGTKLTTEEAYFYVLEALPMALASVAWNIFHPGRFLVGPESEFPRKTRAEKKAIKAEKKRVKEEKKKEKRDEKEQQKRFKMEAKQMKRMQRRGTFELEMGPRPATRTEEI
ncbi:hypothetical protein ABW19_dt0202155 [Dactylella cylindrospora]|nr:hypothetical protein ABW19_dt0202155 [Dactylella cylindrospora]